MPEELEEVIEEIVDDSTDEEVIEEAVRDSLVITVPIDQTLSVSGAAADALAVGNALGAKASLENVKTDLSVNGRTGGGTFAITVNGDDIPASGDEDEETVAEVLERLDTALGSEQTTRQTADTALGTRIDTLTTRVGTEETARANADTALGTRIGTEETARANADSALSASVTSLGGRVDALEANRIISVIVEFTEAGLTGEYISAMTADHVLLSYQFFDSLGDPTGDVLADMFWVTMEGRYTVTFSNVTAAGAVRLVFGVMDDVTPQEVGS